MGHFEEVAERWIWAALGAMILAVAATLILWFPFERPGFEPGLSRGNPPETHTLGPELGQWQRAASNGAWARLERLRGRGPQRDPFLSPGEAQWARFVEQISAGVPRPQGVVEREGERFVLVRGRLLRVGDTVEGFQVVEIDSDSVVFDKDGRAVRVRLKQARGIP